jgi:cytochrome c peroxidase
MFAALRVPVVRRAALSAQSAIPKPRLRFPFRKFTTTPPPPPPKSNTALYAGLGLAIAGGVGYYFYTSSDTPGTILASGAQAAKAKVFTPKKEDYQKVEQHLVYTHGCVR